MFDVAGSELLVILVVAVIFIGPKDMPAALRLAGKWVAKIRRTSSHFRAGFDAMVREAELAEMEREWKEKNAQIMAQSPPADAAEAGVETEVASYPEPLPPETTPMPADVPAPKVKPKRQAASKPKPAKKAPAAKKVKS